jgi:quinoprotein glucose dehydrogenase
MAMSERPNRMSKCLALALAAWIAPTALLAETSSWPSYGNDPGGSRYAPLDQITPANVSSLEVAWIMNHGDVARGPGFRTTSAFEATPILVEGTLFTCTPFNRVLALDPATGTERWQYDPGVDTAANWANQLTCRGVSTWLDGERGDGEACRRRIFTNTVDARLIALDAATGKPCPDFGRDGQVDLNPGVGEQQWRGEYSLTSPPAVAGDLVFTGSAVGDNVRVDAPSGVVRAWDARTGAMRWAWDLAPPDAAGLSRADGTGYVLSTPNVWAPMAVDEARDLLFVPTGNPTPDYATGHRKGLDHFGSSIVALRASTGERVWHFQTVHHDLWDFDVPAQPTLFPLVREGRRVPAVVQATKMGLLFTFHRETGEPLFPIEERPVPTEGAPEGYVVSKTQPFPTKPPPLVRHTLSPEDAWGVTFWDRGACREAMEALRFDGIYTPPSEQGTLMYPGNAGGSNWGGVAVDPERQILVANVQDFPWVVTLIPRADFDDAKASGGHGEWAPQTGTSHGMRRIPLLSPLGVPCNPPPWGELVGVDLATGEIRWRSTLGTIRDIAPVPIPWKLGTPNLGGPLVTGGGLVFIGAAADDYLRAFDVETGEELWKGRLPAGGQATPMTYVVDGRQYVLISAGGYGRGPMTLGDAIVAYRLPASP